MPPEQTLDVKPPAKGADPLPQASPAKDPPAKDPPAAKEPVEKKDPAATAFDAPHDPDPKDPAPNTGDFPETWREKLAGDDDELLRELNRFKSPKAVIDSWRAGRQRIRSGELKAALPENATDEQKANYRKAHGLPDKPEAYEYKPPAGMEEFALDEGGKEQIAVLQKAAFDNGMSPQAWNAVTGWYNAQVQRAAEETASRDAGDKDAFEDAFRSEMGLRYRPAVKQIDDFLVAEVGEDLASSLYHARLPDGSLLGNNLAVMRLISKMADLNGTEILETGDRQMSGTSIEGEMAELEAIMSTDINKYYRGIAPNTGGKTYQQRYTQLLAEKEKRASKGRRGDDE